MCNAAGTQRWETFHFYVGEGQLKAQVCVLNGLQWMGEGINGQVKQKKNETLNISENIALTLCACGCYSHSLPKEMREVNSACGTTSAGCSRLPLGGRSKKPTKVQHNHALHGLWHNPFTLLAGVLAAARHGNLTSRKTKDEPESRDGPTCTTHDTSPSTSLSISQISQSVYYLQKQKTFALSPILPSPQVKSLFLCQSQER